jgi:cytochrome c oxidase cbb3-type subunit 3
MTVFASTPEEDTIPSIERGAEIYMARCALCHGGQAMGEGKLPLKIEDYPNTNLMKGLKAKDLDSIRDAVIYGGILDDFSLYMPPFGNELTWTEIESISQFVSDLRKDPEPLLAMLQDIDKQQEKTSDLGRITFENRCVLCHGVSGQGDGRMAKIIKTPPPYNLTKSLMQKEYLSLIIASGGEPLGRSPQMPPWKDQLSPKEIDAVADYIIGLRSN